MDAIGAVWTRNRTNRYWILRWTCPECDARQASAFNDSDTAPINGCEVLCDVCEHSADAWRIET